MKTTSENMPDAGAAFRLSNPTRRELLSVGAASLASLGLARIAHGFQGASNPYAPFRMGIQSYSLRGYGFEEALDRTRELGLGHWESFQSHIPLTDDPVPMWKALRALAARGINLEAWGVQGFDGNGAFALKVFEFAKSMRIPVISADPAPEALPILEDLAREFDIRIAIHNHGPNSRYDKLASVLAAVEGRDDRIGACVDTGHALRSKEDPVEWIRKLGSRVHGVHLKDVKDATRFTILGKGDLRLRDCLAALSKLGYGGAVSLEYEENPSNPIADLKECLKAAREAIRAL